MTRVLLGLCLLLPVSCGSESRRQTGGSGEGRACSPGETQSCVCTDTGEGAQTCEADGLAWGTCTCGPGEGEGEGEGPAEGEGEGEGGREPIGPRFRTVQLLQPGLAGSSEVPREAEPLEVPLRCGIVNAEGEAYWKLDEGGADSGPRGNDASVPDGAQAPVEANGFLADLGSPSLSFSHPGTPLVVAETTVSDFVGTGLSVAFWLWHEPVGGQAQDEWAVARRGADNPGVRIGLGGDGPRRGQVIATLSDGGGHCLAEPLASGATFDDRAWHHVVLTQVGPRRLRLWVDGRLVHAITMDRDCNVSVSGGTATLGCDGPACPDGGWSGRIDDVVVLSRGLSAREVGALRSCGAEFGAEATSPGWPLSLVQDGPAEAQPDFDDLRVTELREHCPELEVPFEVFGARPLADRLADLDEHVLAYWPLDGGPLELRSGQPDVLGGAPQPVTGRFGRADGALRFDDTTFLQAVRPELDVAGPLTLEAWVRRTGGGPDMQVVAGYWQEQEVWSYRLTLDEGVPKCTFRKADGGWAVLFAADPLPPGRWTHVACTWDGQEPLVYVDGLSRFGRLASGGPQVRPLPAGFWIGRSCLGDTDHLHAELDEVVVHDVVRSPDWIHKRAHPLPTARLLVSTVFSRVAGAYPYRTYRLYYGDAEATRSDWSSTEGLLSEARGYVGWWRFLGDGGTTLVDESANRNHGKLHEGTPDPPAHGPQCLDAQAGAHVQVERSDSLGATEALSLEVRAQRTDSTGFLAYHDDGQEGGWALETLALTAARLLRRTAAGLGEAHRSNLRWPAEGFSHLAVTATPGAELEPYKGVWFYLDGRLASGLLLSPAVLGPDEGLAGGATLHLLNRPEGSAPFTGLVDEIRIMNRPLALRHLLHGTPTAFKLGAVLDGRPPEGEEDSDGDGVPDVTECAVETGLGDPAVPILGWRDGFEAGETPGEPGSDWTVVEGSDCLELAAGRSRAGTRSLHADATGACERVVLTSDAALADAEDPLLVGAWFYDEGGGGPVAVGEHLRLEIHGSDGSATSVGYHSGHDERRNTVTHDWGEPPLRRIARGRGWHLAGLIRQGDGRTWGYLDGQLLGTVQTAAAPLTLQLSVQGVRAWFDEAMVLRSALEVD